MKNNINSFNSGDKTIGVVGLGYVGLPLACLFARKFKVVGFDLNQERIAQLNDGFDKTNEIETKEELLQENLSYTSDKKILENCSVIVIAVPTPITQFKTPDLGMVQKASKTVGSVLKKGSVVVFESTVYPGVTEDVCGLILEQESGLQIGKDFTLGYSPERVNPGDKEHTIDKIIKVVSGSDDETTDFLCDLYSSVITAGVHRCPNIKTAEASKVIENTQRDLNIAIINELSVIFDKIGLDTKDVLKAAGTKWNFLKFTPGLVGGHCIGVDPYYLSYLAEGVGVHPQLIQAGRRINDGMAEFVANKCVNLMLNGSSGFEGSLHVGILGVTFKENVPDTRNTKVVDVANKLESSGVKVSLVDPLADTQEFYEEYGKNLVSWNELNQCDAIIMAVNHSAFKNEISIADIAEKLQGPRLLVDLKDVYDREEVAKHKLKLWRL